MEKIFVEWLEWTRPTKLGVSSYEQLKVAVGKSRSANLAFEELRVLLHPESLGAKDILAQMKFEGMVYLSGIVVFLLSGWIEGIGDWLYEFDNGFAASLAVLVTVVWFVAAIYLICVATWCALKMIMFWPSVALYVLRNRMFVRRRLRAIQESRSYEDYLNRE